ncbi:hypothetical protein KCP75_08060 [Salmonella enterica subsp. enterica]|nr:hypothetical protein KCP75_08060 [Salmonella enterica subsp. enterica]
MGGMRDVVKIRSTAFHSGSGSWNALPVRNERQKACTALLRYNPTISAVVLLQRNHCVGAWFGLLSRTTEWRGGVDRYFERAGVAGGVC